MSENGFKFSTSQTVCIHFHQQCGFFPDPNIFLGKTPKKEAKFLGLIFDTKLTFKNHVQHLKFSCQKALHTLRVVRHTDWGADRIVLLRLYRATPVRSKLDYECVVYGSARRLLRNWQLDPIHHQGLRIALGAFRISPAHSLYVEAHEPSLASRRLKLSLNYVLKLESLPENPPYSCVFEPENIQLSEESKSKIPPFGIRILPHLEKSKISLNLTDDAPSLDITPWTLSAPTVRFDLTKLKKDTANPETYKQFCLHLITEYPLSETVFNDGSKTEGVAAATVSTKRSRKPFTCRLPDDSSIHTAELRAILLTLKHAYCSTRRSFVILSDSLSSLLQAIVNLKYDHPALVQIVEF